MLPIKEREEVCTGGVREGCTGAPYKRERGGVHKRVREGCTGVLLCPARALPRAAPLTLGCPRLAVASLAIARARPRAPHTPRPALALSPLSRCAVRHRAPPPLGVRGER